MLTSMETVGDRLRRARLEMKLSQEDLANDIGATRSAIAQVESGISTSLNAENLARAARRLGKSAVWLATGEGEEDAFESVIEAVQEMPDPNRKQTIDFILYQLQNYVVPYLEQPRARHYEEMIERLKRDRDRLRKNEPPKE